MGIVQFLVVPDIQQHPICPPVIPKHIQEFHVRKNEGEDFALPLDESGLFGGQNLVIVFDDFLEVNEGAEDHIPCILERFP